MKPRQKKLKRLSRKAKRGKLSVVTGQQRQQKTCQPCQHGLRTVSPVEMAPDVVGVLCQIEAGKEQRRKDDIAESLETILERVKLALEHAGFSSNLVPTPSETDAIMSTLSQGGGFDPKLKREEMEQKKKMLHKVSQYCMSLSYRKGVFAELSQWLNTNSNLGGCLIPEEDITAQGEEIDACHKDIMDSIDVAFAAGVKIKEIGMILLKEAGLLQSEDEEDDMKKLSPKARLRIAAKDIMEENALLDPANFLKACADIKKRLEESVKFVRGAQPKNDLKNACKQYKFVMTAMDKRLADLKNKAEEVLSLNMKVDQLKNSAEKYKTECGKLERRVNSLDSNMLKLQAKTKELSMQNEDLKSEVAELQEQKEEWVNMSMMASSSSEIVSPERALSRRLSTITPARRSSMSAGPLKAAQEELHECREQLQQEVAKSVGLEKKLSQEKEKLAMLVAKLEVAEGMSSQKTDIDAKLNEEAQARMRSLHQETDTLERQVARLKSELNCKNELIDYQDRRIEEMKEDLGIIDLEELAKGEKKDGTPVAPDMKRTIQRLQKDFEGEVNRLKAHVEKEKQRHEATIRKLEQSHKDQLLNVHKQSIHLLRAINRFKESVAQILDRECLPVAASEIRRVPNLRTDEAPSDPKMLLAQMAGSAVELLVTVEFKLSQALMNKRLEIKDNSIARNFATKDLEAQTDAAQKAKQMSDILSVRMKEMKGKLDVAESALTTVRTFEDARYTGLTDRYRQLMQQYINVQKDLTRLQRESSEALKNKEQAMKSVLEHKRGMARVVEEQSLAISAMQSNINKRQAESRKKLALSIVDQRLNMAMLEKAFKENRISKEMFSMTKQITKQSMELPGIRLRHLFERYIAHRGLKDVQDHLKQQINDDRLPDNRRSELQTFLQRMGNRLVQTNNSWLEEQGRLEQKRKDLLYRMASIFNEVIVENGILLIPPESKSQRPSSGSTAVTRSTVKSRSSGYSTGSSRFPQIHRAVSPEVNLPHELVGTTLPLIHEKETMWHVPTVVTPPPIPVILSTPRILDLEVNQKIRAAQKALKRIRLRQSFPISRVDSVDFEELHSRLVEMKVKSMREADDSSSGLGTSQDTTQPSSVQDGSVYSIKIPTARVGDSSR